MGARFFVALASVLTLSSGCVSKTRYIELETQFGQSQQQVAELKSQNDRLQQIVAAQDAAAQRRLQAFRELVADLKPLVDQGLLEVTVDDGRVVVGMASDVLFASGSAALSEKGRDTVVKVGRMLVKRTDRDLQVQGHTDNDPIATKEFPDNWRLGAARALAVVDAMTAAGVPAERLSAATYAQHRKIVPNNSDANKARNRRIEIVIEPDFSDLPGFEQLMSEVKEPRRRGPRPPPQGGKGKKQEGGQ